MKDELVEKIASGIDYYLHRVAELTEERRLELGNPEWMDYTEQDKIAKNEAAKGILQAILSDPSMVEIKEEGRQEAVDGINKMLEGTEFHLCWYSQGHKVLDYGLADKDGDAVDVASVLGNLQGGEKDV